MFIIKTQSSSKNATKYYTHRLVESKRDSMGKVYKQTILNRLSRTYWGVVISLYMGYSGVDKYIICNNRHQNVQFHTLTRYRFFKNNSSNH